MSTRTSETVTAVASMPREVHEAHRSRRLQDCYQVRMPPADHRWDPRALSQHVLRPLDSMPGRRG